MRDAVRIAYLPDPDLVPDKFPRTRRTPVRGLVGTAPGPWPVPSWTVALDLLHKRGIERSGGEGGGSNRGLAQWYRAGPPEDSVMLRSILIGLDGSAFSTSAVELGFRWARQFNAFLVGLGIVDEPTIRESQVVQSGAGAQRGENTEARVEEARRKVAEFLEQFAIRCLEAGVPDKLVEKVGLPCERILLEAQRYDLILLGQQSYSSLRRGSPLAPRSRRS
jgi:nucleotide-binding universal stress UspA family protein